MTDKLKVQKETQQFENAFEEAEREIIILTNNSGTGARKAGQKLLWTVSAHFLAYYDCETKKLVEVNDRVEWLANDDQRGNWIHNLKGETIYRLKVRQSKPEKYKEMIQKEAMKTLPNFQHRFMLVEVLEREAAHSGLDEILANYRKPVILSVEKFGNFELEKDLRMFEGSIQWLGEEALIYLDTDNEEAETADDCLTTLKQLTENQVEWDKKLRSFAAENLTDLANDWLEDEEAEAITPETFSKRITICELAIHNEGNFECYYRDDDMFWGHAILIDGNVDGRIFDATIAG